MAKLHTESRAELATAGRAAGVLGLAPV
jgi:hypothetical protein